MKRMLATSGQLGLVLLSLSFSEVQAGVSSGSVVAGGAVSSGGGSKVFSTVGLPLAGTSGRVLGTAIGNRAPSFSGLGDQTLTAESNFSLGLAATDLDGDAVSFAVSGNPSGSSLAGSTFSWTPSSSQTGSHSATFTATDAWGGIVVQTVNFTVNAAAVTTPDPDPTPAEPSEPAGPVVLPPKLTTVADTLDFGTVIVGQAQSLSLQIASQDTTSFTSAPIVFTGTQAQRFDSGEDRLTVPAGGQGALEVVFAPTDESPLAVVVALDYGATFLEVVLLGRGVLPGPRLEIGANTLDFGIGRVGSATTKAFTLTNVGTDTLHVTELAVDATRFQALPAAFAVAPGDTQRVEVNFWRPEPGIIADVLEVRSDAIAGVTGLTFSGESGLPLLALGAEEVRFDDVHFTRLVSPGGRLVKTLEIANGGFVNLELTSLTIGGPSFAVEPAAATVAAGDTLAVTVAYTPKEGGIHADTLLIRSDDPERGALKVVLGGATLGSIGPQLQVVDRFGLGSVSSGFLVVENLGNFALQVDSLRVENTLFSVDREALLIAAGARDSLRVTFAGNDNDAAQGALTLFSDDPLESSRRVVLLSGAVDELPAGPVAIDFNTVRGDQGQRSLGGVAIGSRYDIQLVANGAPPISGWGVLLEFDPAQVAYVPGSFRPGTLLPDLLELVVGEGGRLSVGGTVSGAQASSAGDGVLATLSFAIGAGFAGRTELAISEVSWRRPDEADEILLVRSLATLTSRPVVQPGDFDGNGRVDFDDFFLFAEAFESTDPVYDLDDSGRVDFLDFFLFADFFTGNARAKLLALAARYLALPQTSGLSGNFPNPFNLSTTLSYQVGAPARVRLDVFDISGQRVRTLVDAPVVAGWYQVRWDGLNEVGQAVATGVYFSRLLVGDGIYLRKMLLLK